MENNKMVKLKRYLKGNIRGKHKNNPSNQRFVLLCLSFLLPFLVIKGVDND